MPYRIELFFLLELLDLLLDEELLLPEPELELELESELEFALLDDVVAVPAFCEVSPLCSMYDGIYTVFRFVTYTFFRENCICRA